VNAEPSTGRAGDREIAAEHLESLAHAGKAASFDKAPSTTVVARGNGDCPVTRLFQPDDEFRGLGVPQGVGDHLLHAPKDSVGPSWVERRQLIRQDQLHFETDRSVGQGVEGGPQINRLYPYTVHHIAHLLEKSTGDIPRALDVLGFLPSRQATGHVQVDHERGERHPART